MNCPGCKESLPPDFSEPWCPFCGCDLAHPGSSEPPKAPVKKQSYWPIFWLAFLGAPVLGLLSASTNIGGGILLFPILGAIVAGFALAKIFTKSPATFAVAGILFSLGIFVVYVGIVFVGCLVVAQGLRGI